MFGLPQVGMLTNKLLKERLTKYGYYEPSYIPRLFNYKTRPVWFTLTVDDFEVKYIGKEYTQHSMVTLKFYYKTEEDWKGELYCEITLI